MNPTTLLLLLGLTGTVCSSPVCPTGCEKARSKTQCFTHVSDLGNSSVAPWTLSPSSQEGRHPDTIRNAICGNCTIKNMTAKPIIVQTMVYQRVRNGASEIWCMCPYELAVGCTCVSHNDTRKALIR